MIEQMKEHIFVCICTQSLSSLIFKKFCLSISVLRHVRNAMYVDMKLSSSQKKPLPEVRVQIPLPEKKPFCSLPI